MRRRSQTGKNYASLAKLLNSLIVFTIMGVIGFAMLPSFLMPSFKTVSAAKELNTKVQPARLRAGKKNMVYSINYHSNTKLSAGSGVTKTAVFRDYDVKRPIKRGSTL